MNNKQAIIAGAIALALSSPAIPAEHRFILPIDTIHTRNNSELNGATPGLGYEYHNDGFNLTFLHLHENSYGDPSNYYIGSSEHRLDRNNAWLRGVGFGTNYKELVEHGVIIFHMFGYEFYGFRAITSWPTAELTCPRHKTCGDFIHLQYVVRF